MKQPDEPSAGSSRKTLLRRNARKPLRGTVKKQAVRRNSSRDEEAERELLKMFEQK